MARTVCEEPSCGLVKCDRDQKYLQIGSTGRKCSLCCLCYCYLKRLFPQWPLPHGSQAEESLSPVREAKALICWGDVVSPWERREGHRRMKACTHTAASSDCSYADLVCSVLLGCAFLPRKCLGWSALILRMSLEECAETQAARASSGFSCLHSPVLGVVLVQGLHVGLIVTQTIAICAHPPNTMPRCIIERSFKIW